MNDLVNASLYLERLVKGNRIMTPTNEVHKVFLKNIRSGRAERLLKELKFGGGKDLYRSPLIPLRRGYFLIAGWVFSLGMHFESWIRPIIENTDIYGMYSDFIGKTFENYVKDLIEPLVDKIRLNITITEQERPEIKPWLDRFRPKKEGGFEIDIVAVRGEFAFVISCKGGKKELPKLRISKMWAEFPEKEILDRTRDNKKEIEEIWMECRCVASSGRLMRDLGIEGKKIVPVVVYSTIQPLSLPKLRNAHKVPPDVLLATPKKLKNLITRYNVS